MQYPLVNAADWRLVPFTECPTHDRIWAMARGADGHIYIGLCQERIGGMSAQLYRYHTARRRLERLLDMAQVTGEPGDDGRAPQGKIHFSLCPASDGRLYGTTHCTTPPLGHSVWNPYGMWDDPQHGYPGGHVFRYDPRSGETVDFGIPFPNEGLPFMLLDEARGRLYGVTYPKAHFFRMNLVARDVVDYGRISSWYPIAMCFDTQGNLYTSDTNSQLIKYDVAQDRLVFTRQTPFANPWNRSRRFSWMSNLNLADDGMIYGTHYHNAHLFRFDPRAASPQIEDLGDAVPGAAIRLARCLVPDGYGRIYYMALMEDVTQGYLWCVYTIRSGAKKVLGRLCVNGTKIGSWIGVSDTRGDIYVMGGIDPMRLAIYSGSRADLVASRTRRHARKV